VVERAPYMHDGSERTLEGVIDLYDAGGRVRRASVSSDIRPLNLTAGEKRDLIAFLRTLSSRDTVVASTTLSR
jgi:cytochrome c peroxidase